MMVSALPVVPLTFAGLHAAKSQRVCEHDVRLGIAHDLVVHHHWDGAPWVVSCSALNLRVGHRGHITGHLVNSDRDELRVVAKS